MKISKKILIASLFLLLGSIIIYNYIYKDHRTIADEKPSFITTTENILDEFSKNSSIAEKKYLDKTIEISGMITEINENYLTLDNVAFCKLLDNTSNKVLLKQKINLKGRFIGYDDLLEQIKLDQCNIYDE